MEMKYIPNNGGLFVSNRNLYNDILKRISLMFVEGKASKSNSRLGNLYVAYSYKPLL